MKSAEKNERRQVKICKMKNINKNKFAWKYQPLN